MQNWIRIQYYPHDYLQLVYRYYAVHAANSYICTYYHLDIARSTIDTDILNSGSYQITGDWSGRVWEKISLFPIYNTQPMQPVAFTADERGFGKFDQRTTLNFPCLYNLIPTTCDFIIFDEPVINENEEPHKNSPLYHVSNKEKATNAFFSFWNINLEIDYHTKEEIENQVNANYAYVDYEKRIYPINTAITMLNSLAKNDDLQMNPFFNERTGLYYGT